MIESQIVIVLTLPKHSVSITEPIFGNMVWKQKIIINVVCKLQVL